MLQADWISVTDVWKLSTNVFIWEGGCLNVYLNCLDFQLQQNMPWLHWMGKWCMWQGSPLFKFSATERLNVQKEMRRGGKKWAKKKNGPKEKRCDNKERWSDTSHCLVWHLMAPGPWWPSPSVNWGAGSGLWSSNCNVAPLQKPVLNRGKAFPLEGPALFRLDIRGPDAHPHSRNKGERDRILKLH